MIGASHWLLATLIAVAVHLAGMLWLSVSAPEARQLDANDASDRIVVTLGRDQRIAIESADSPQLETQVAAPDVTADAPSVAEAEAPAAEDAAPPKAEPSAATAPDTPRDAARSVADQVPESQPPSAEPISAAPAAPAAVATAAPVTSRATDSEPSSDVPGVVPEPAAALANSTPVSAPPAEPQAVSGLPVGTVPAPALATVRSVTVTATTATMAPALPADTPPPAIPGVAPLDTARPAATAEPVQPAPAAPGVATQVPETRQPSGRGDVAPELAAARPVAPESASGAPPATASGARPETAPVMRPEAVRGAPPQSAAATTPETVRLQDLQQQSDSTGVVAHYAGVLKGWLQQSMHYPRAARLAGQEGEVVVRFVIDRQGRVQSVELESGSGYPLLDREATEMVERGDPFPAIPSDMRGDRLEVRVPVTFQVRGEDRSRTLPPIDLQ